MFKFFRKNTDESEETIRKMCIYSQNVINYISNYSFERFYYKYFNKFLREGNLDNIRIIVSHISKYIYHLNEYRKNINQSYINSSILYKNIYLSSEDFNAYLESINQVICYPAFTLTSLDENFMPEDPDSNELFVKLIIDKNSSKSVVSLASISENEYLFLPFSFFKILEVRQGSGNKDFPHIIHLSALNSDKSIEELFLDFMGKETDILEPEGLDMLCIKDSENKIIINPNLLANGNL